MTDLIIKTIEGKLIAKLTRFSTGRTRLHILDETYRGTIVPIIRKARQSGVKMRTAQDVEINNEIIHVDGWVKVTRKDEMFISALADEMNSILPESAGLLAEIEGGQGTQHLPYLKDWLDQLDQMGGMSHA
jgi:hypothetical protein